MGRESRKWDVRVLGRQASDRWARYTHASAGRYASRANAMAWMRRVAGMAAPLIPALEPRGVAPFHREYEARCKALMAGRTVLDIGAGPGHVSTEIESYGARRYIGLDIAARLLRFARERYPQHAYVLGDAHALPFADGSIDVVTTTFTFHHLAPETRAATIRELLRVSRDAVIIRDLFGVERGPARWLYQTYASILDGSMYRFTLGEWARCIEQAGGRIVARNHTSPRVLLHRHCYFQVAPAIGADSTARTPVRTDAHDMN